MNNQIKEERIKESIKNTPEKKFVSGAMVATVWKNSAVAEDGKVKEFKTVSFERRYKDKDGTWKSSHSLRVADIPKANLILSKTYEYLSMKNQESAE